MQGQLPAASYIKDAVAVQQSTSFLLCIESRSSTSTSTPSTCSNWCVVLRMKYPSPSPAAAVNLLLIRFFYSLALSVCAAVALGCLCLRRTQPVWTSNHPEQRQQLPLWRLPRLARSASGASRLDLASRCAAAHHSQRPGTAWTWCAWRWLWTRLAIDVCTADRRSLIKSLNKSFLSLIEMCLCIVFSL